MAIVNPDLLRFSKKLDRMNIKVMRAVGKEIWETLVSDPPIGTPVLHGIARDAWHFGVNRTIDTPPLPRPVPRGSLVYPRPTATPDRDDFDVHIQSRDEINISNTAPYIARLDEGYSQQSPAGFIESAVDRV